MKVLVLGMGLQGKAVVHDLEQSDMVREILVAEKETGPLEAYMAQRKYRKTVLVRADAADPDGLSRLISGSGAAAVICMLPPDFGYPVASAAITAGIPFISSSYTGRIVELDEEARRRGVTVLPEMGMDPGIDLVLGRLAISELDEVHGLYSYGAGVPEAACADDNPLRYKITWTFEGVLKAYVRPARYLEDGKEYQIPGDRIFRKENIHTVEVPGVGSLEAYRNGDAIHYATVFGLGESLKSMGRFAMRWPGHCELWSKLIDLGFLDETPIAVDGASISPRRFLVAHLTPRLQFGPDERDVAIIRIQAWGIKAGKPLKVTYDMVDYRDLETGLFAMNRMVGYTTSIGAQMILSGAIRRPGVLSPIRHVPPEALLSELRARNMMIERRVGDP